MANPTPYYNPGTAMQPSYSAPSYGGSAPSPWGQPGTGSYQPGGYGSTPDTYFDDPLTQPIMGAWGQRMNQLSRPGPGYGDINAALGKYLQPDPRFNAALGNLQGVRESVGRDEPVHAAVRESDEAADEGTERGPVLDQRRGRAQGALLRLDGAGPRSAPTSRTPRRWRRAGWRRRAAWRRRSAPRRAWATRRPVRCRRSRCCSTSPTSATGGATPPSACRGTSRSGR